MLLLLSQSPWKEYTADNGKIYYHNINTKESRWVIPPELEEIKIKIASEDSKPPGLKSVGGTPPEIASPATPAMAAISISAPVSDVNSPNSTDSPGGKSALEAAMAATLAAIAIPTPPPKADEDSNLSTHSEPKESARNSSSSTPEPAAARVFKDKKEAMEAFKEMLRDNNVASNATWDQCVKAIQSDARYESLKRLNERKQVFNAYKTQKQKDEKEESRLRAKKSKDSLEEFLLASDRITSTTKYYKCDEIFTGLEVWNCVSDSDRRDIYEDVVFSLAKREKEEAKVLKKRNMKKLAEVMNNMAEINYDTTWSEAQTMLLGNSAFKNDVNLLAMDKEDALVVFEDHIRELEKEEVEEKERQKKRLKRQARKNRDQFLVLLDMLHEEGKLTSMSLWVELYPIISADIRFSAMLVLGQSGSTPLDLFKFYVEDLKARFHDEKKIIKEILKDKEFEVRANTTFEAFATVVCEDKKSATLDAGNVKLTYNSLLEKAEAKEKERLKEESKRLKKLEAGFKNRLRELNFNYELPWEAAKLKLENEEEYTAFASDGERSKVYKSFQHEMEESCSHHHSRSKKSKKSKKTKKYKSSSNSDSEAAAADAKEREREREKEKKEKKKQHRTPSPPCPAERGGGVLLSGEESGDNEAYRKSQKKSKKKHKNKKTPSMSPPPDVRNSSSKAAKSSCSSSSASRRPSECGDAKSGELSESELEKQRALLLEQLKEPESD